MTNIIRVDVFWGCYTKMGYRYFHTMTKAKRFGFDWLRGEIAELLNDCSHGEQVRFGDVEFKHGIEDGKDFRIVFINLENNGNYFGIKIRRIS